MQGAAHTGMGEEIRQNISIMKAMIQIMKFKRKQYST